MNLKYHSGFTLIEVAIVLLIIAALLAASFMPLRAQRESANIQKAREQLKAIEEALYGFAIANGRLPCPTLPGQNGIEQPVGGGACTNENGFVPSATLGLKGDVNCDELLMDPWQRPYRYSVTTSNASAFTTNNGMATVTLPILAPNLTVSALTNNAVAVYFSMGSNIAASADQTENAGEAVANSTCGLAAYGLSNDNDFVYGDRVELAGSEFDDIVYWMSPNILYSKMLSAGQL